MIRPLRSRIMPLAARRAQRNAPARLVSMTASKSSSLIRISSVSRVTPALATRTSIGPPRISSASAKAWSTDAESVTSHLTPRKPSGGSPDRCVMTTWSPASTRALAMLRPIPRLPPVTSTLRPAMHSSVSCRVWSGHAAVRALELVFRTLSTTHGYAATAAAYRGHMPRRHHHHREGARGAVGDLGSRVAGRGAGRQDPPLPGHHGHPHRVLHRGRRRSDPGGAVVGLGLLALAAIVLPYVAVVMANAVRPRQSGTAVG